MLRNYMEYAWSMQKEDGMREQAPGSQDLQPELVNCDATAQATAMVRSMHGPASLASVPPPTDTFPNNEARLKSSLGVAVQHIIRRHDKSVDWRSKTDLPPYRSLHRPDQPTTR